MGQAIVHLAGYRDNSFLDKISGLSRSGLEDRSGGDGLLLVRSPSDRKSISLSLSIAWAAEAVTHDVRGVKRVLAQRLELLCATGGSISPSPRTPGHLLAASSPGL